MIITLNGTPLDYTLEKEKNIGEVLGSIESLCRQEQATIIQVAADGKILTPDDLDRLFAEPVDSEVTIDLSTLSGAEVRSYMHTLAQELLASADEFERIPVYMQTGKDAQVLSVLQAFSQKLNELYRAFLLSDITGIPVDIPIQGKSLQSYQKEISSLLNDIVSSIEDKDIIQVGDLAEYELAPLVKDLINGVLCNLV
ncbi:MAG: hypothetical protein P1P65_06840 [Treponema sp.]